MTGLKNIQVDLGDIVKYGIGVAPVIVTLVLAWGRFAAWAERVNLRLDDIDKDLKSIHQHYDHQPPVRYEPQGSKLTWRPSAAKISSL